MTALDPDPADRRDLASSSSSAAMVGAVLLIVPGVMFYIAMSVAVPALIEERAGVFGSMRRSYRLTRGSWLQIFVLLILYLIFRPCVSTVFSLAFGVRNFGFGYNDPADGRDLQRPQRRRSTAMIGGGDDRLALHRAAHGQGRRDHRRPGLDLRVGPGEDGGGRTRARTWDPLIKSQLLYQLSYASMPACGGRRPSSGAARADCNRWRSARCRVASRGVCGRSTSACRGRSSPSSSPSRRRRRAAAGCRRRARGPSPSAG